MGLSSCRKILLALSALITVFIASVASAAVPTWQIVPQASNITFTATQNNAPTSGQFKTFTGQINFDPAQLNNSNVHIVINIGSLTTGDPEIAQTLQTPDWFSAKLFPQAVFAANNFTKTGDKTYQAKGTLTIRDKTVPTTVSFVLEEYSPTKALVKGTAAIKRNDFGVGKGEWSSTDVVKNDVKVNFQITATKK